MIVWFTDSDWLNTRNQVRWVVDLEFSETNASHWFVYHMECEYLSTLNNLTSEVQPVAPVERHHHDHDRDHDHFTY